jgi:hypothetical protein
MFHESTPECPHCGSTDIGYREYATNTYDVFDMQNNTIRIGKCRDEDVTDNHFFCWSCDREVDTLDEKEKLFLL